MKKSKKLLSLLLAVLLIAALMPMSVLAAETETAPADGLLTYAVYVKNAAGIPAAGAKVVLTEQVRLLDGTVGVGKSYVFQASALGLILIPKHLTGVYTITAEWTSPLFGIRHISAPGLHWSASIAPDLDLITVFPVPDLKLNYTDHTRYLQGYPDGTVRPNGCLTRAEAAAMLYRVVDPSEFRKDVSSRLTDIKGHWAEKEITALASKGIIRGVTATTFDPDAPILRRDLFTMIGRLFVREFTTDGIIGNFFVDLGNSYYTQSIDLLYNLGLVRGDANAKTVRPNDKITRAETATLLNRLLLRQPDSQSADACSNVVTWPDCKKTDWFYADVMEASNTHNYTIELKVLTLGNHFAEVWTETHN